MNADSLLDPLIGLCHRAIVSKKGDQFAPIRFSREALRAINDLFGQPICSTEERVQRRIDRQQPVPPPPSLFRTKAPGSGPGV